jgi:hypothetical protein
MLGNSLPEQQQAVAFFDPARGHASKSIATRLMPPTVDMNERCLLGSGKGGLDG